MRPPMSQNNTPIPLPHFPYAHRAAVDQQIQSILAQLNSVFPSKTVVAHSQYEARDRGIKSLQENLECIDGNIRGQFLQLATVRRVLKEINEGYDFLKEAQASLMTEIEDLTSRPETQKPRLPVLPAELVQMICSFSGAGAGEHDARGEESWGEMLYKAVPFCCSLMDLFSAKAQIEIRNGTRLYVFGLPIHQELDKFLQTTTPPSDYNFGVWTELFFCIPANAEGPGKCAEILRRCRPSVSTVKRVQFTMQRKQGLQELLDSDKSFLDLKLPACTDLTAPFHLVPWLRGLIPHLSHLEVDIGDSSNLTVAGLISTFEGVNLHSLRSLKIYSYLPFSFDNTDYHGNPLVLPDLQQLTIGNDKDTVPFEVVIPILESVVCEKLERLDIFSLTESSGLATGLIKSIGKRFKGLRRLSVNKIRRTGDAVFCELRSNILPNLEHLSLFIDLKDINEVMGVLLLFLEQRKNRFNTLELHVPSNWNVGSQRFQQQFWVDYIGLFVRNVLIVPYLP